MRRQGFEAAADKNGAETFLYTGGRSNSANVEQAKKIAQCIVAEQLTPRQQELLLLYMEPGGSMSRIAQELGINKSTVSRTLARALRRLRERMRYYDFRA